MAARVLKGSWRNAAPEAAPDEREQARLERMARAEADLAARLKLADEYCSVPSALSFICGP